MQIFDANGQFVMTVGSHGTGDGQINNALGAAIDQDGNIILLDRGNHRVQIFG
jgi:DNA-binding beta-propeller fold protein YncE